MTSAKRILHVREVTTGKSVPVELIRKRSASSDERFYIKMRFGPFEYIFDFTSLLTITSNDEATQPIVRANQVLCEQEMKQRGKLDNERLINLLIRSPLVRKVIEFILKNRKMQFTLHDLLSAGICNTASTYRMIIAELRAIGFLEAVGKKEKLHAYEITLSLPELCNVVKQADERLRRLSKESKSSLSGLVRLCMDIECS